MHTMVDLNAGSGFIYGRAAPADPAASQLNGLIDAALVSSDRAKPPRDYLGASRIGEPCSRKLVYEITRTPKDEDRGFDGTILRIFDVGHQLEDLCIGWLRSAGFDVRTRNRAGEQFGFSIAGGRIRGHIDGAIADGPDIGIRWPVFWEHKALGQKSWSDAVGRGVSAARPVYFAQVQLYMAYMQLPVALFTATNRDSLALYHEIVPFDPAQAQALSIKLSRSFVPPRPVSCRRGSPSTPNSTSAAAAHTPAAAGRSIDERQLLAVAAAGASHPRHQGLVREPHQRAAGVPGLGVCGYGEVDSHQVRHRRTRPGHDGPGSGWKLHEHRRRASCGVYRESGAGDDSQGHAGIHHPQPDLSGLGGDQGEIERVKQDIAAIRAKLPTLGPRERLLEKSRLRSLELRLDDIHKPRFVLNEQSIVRDAKLFVRTTPAAGNERGLRHERFADEPFCCRGRAPGGTFRPSFACPHAP